MGTTNLTPVQSSLFPDDSGQGLSPGNKEVAHVAHVSVEAEEDFHDEKLPWAQKGEGLF